MDDSKIRLLVMSDMHAMEGNEWDNDSRLLFNNKGESEFGEGLLRHLKGLGLKFDALICPGDISNKASVKGFELGWQFLNRIKYELQIPSLISVPGNHDHISRNVEGVFCPKHHLQFIEPSFPFECIKKNTHFWAWNWAPVIGDDFNLISLNSSAYHGYQDKEWQKGRLATEVTDQIYNYVKSNDFDRKVFNLLVCHHHPMKMEMVEKTYDGEVMEGGQYLLSKLQEVDKGPWLIIHGHKHYASLDYYSGVDGSPHTVLSAGSVSAKIHENIEDRASNQFYILEIDLKQTSENDRVVGLFTTYEWKVDTGWRLSTLPNLPARGGFGSVIQVGSVVSKVVDLLRTDGPFLREEDLDEIHSMTQHLPPKALQKLRNRLKEKSIEVDMQQERFVEIGVAND